MSRKRKSTDDITKDKHQKLESATHKLQDDIEKLYGMVFPKDLLSFWEFCISIDSKQPLDILSVINLKLVGPFYYIHSGAKKATKSPHYYHLQWRYYFDIPEFLTVLTSCNPENDKFHVGYLRDDPQSVDTCIVVSNDGNNPKYNVLGDNILAAVSSQLQYHAKKSTGDKKQKILSLQKSLQTFCDKEKFHLEANSPLVKARKKKVVTNSFHGAGIVVPVVNGIGYRPLHHTDDQFKKLLRKVVEAKDDDERMNAFEPIQQVVNYVQFANDECDYGMGLELGIDLFCNGSKYFYKMSKMLLTMAYKLLKWDLYVSVCEAHLEDRREANFTRLETN